MGGGQARATTRSFGAGARRRCRWLRVHGRSGVSLAVSSRTHFIQRRLLFICSLLTCAPFGLARLFLSSCHNWRWTHIDHAMGRVCGRECVILGSRRERNMALQPDRRDQPTIVCFASMGRATIRIEPVRVVIGAMVDPRGRANTRLA